MWRKFEKKVMYGSMIYLLLVSSNIGETDKDN